MYKNALSVILGCLVICHFIITSMYKALRNIFVKKKKKEPDDFTMKATRKIRPEKTVNDTFK